MLKARDLVKLVESKEDPKYTVFYFNSYGANEALTRALFDDGGESNIPVSLSDYIELTEVRAADKEHVFYLMQGETWSPMGEARECIRSVGLKHTSMMMGDLVRDPDGQYWVCAMMGFKKVNVQ